MNPPLVTVIIPLKDRLALLKETIASLKSQTSNAWCALLVDDGSNDATKNFLRNLSSSDKRFQFLERKSKYSGPNSCRNIGVHTSTSKYIIFLDSDDILTPNSLYKRIMIMNENQALDFALFSTRVFYDNINKTFPWFQDWNGMSDLDRLLKMDWPMNISSPIWRRTFLLEAGLFDETLPSWDDWEMHTRILIGNPKYLRFDDEPDFLIRSVKNPSRLSNIQFRDSSHLESASNVFVKIVNLLKKQDILTAERSQYLTDQFFGTAYLSLKTDGLRVAIKRLNKSKALMPRLSKPIFYKNIVRLIYCHIKNQFKR